ncbi:MAG: transposase [Desulfuromonas sp.]|nr:MAG: transposase [Desulfuromonas sp.]
MPRISRIVAVGYPHHVTQRGNNRTPVFLDDDDRRKYLELLGDYAAKHDLQVWAYCLMDEHLHLLAVPANDTALSRGIGLTNQVYTQYFNRKYGCSGRVWQNRFFSCVVEDHHYLWAVVRYIINNPVKAGQVKKAEEYPWSNAAALFLQDDEGQLGSREWLKPEDMEGFKAFAKESNSYIENAIRKATSNGRPFGSETFISLLEQRLQMRIKANPVGRPRKQKE